VLTNKDVVSVASGGSGVRLRNVHGMRFCSRSGSSPQPFWILHRAVEDGRGLEGFEPIAETRSPVLPSVG